MYYQVSPTYVPGTSTLLFVLFLARVVLNLVAKYFFSYERMNCCVVVPTIYSSDAPLSTTYQVHIQPVVVVDAPPILIYPQQLGSINSSLHFTRGIYLRRSREAPPAPCVFVVLRVLDGYGSSRLSHTLTRLFFVSRTVDTWWHSSRILAWPGYLCTGVLAQ